MRKHLYLLPDHLFFFSSYEGEWVQDNAEGRGQYHWLSGDLYDGGMYSSYMHAHAQTYMHAHAQT